MSTRILKINELLKEEISIFLEREFGPELGITTITAVETTPDLREAKVWVSVMDKESRDITMAKLEAARWRIQKFVNKQIVLKFVPKLRFALDTSQDKVEEIEHLLKQANRKNEK